MKKLLLAIGFSFALSCTHVSQPGQGVQTFPAPSKAPGEISFMTYNVENLFDLEHDAGKEDFTFLPQSLKDTDEVKNYCRNERNSYYKRECMEKDWNQGILTKKMENIKKAVMQVDGGRGPDILVLVEVENDKVLSELNKNYLAAAEYKTQILIEGNDPRGIDVAVLSRFPTEGMPVLHKIPFKPTGPEDQGKEKILRGILEVTLVLPDKSKLTVFANHFPSQSNPRNWREQYVSYLNQLMEERSKKNPVIGAGDLNITAEEDKETGLISNKLGKNNFVSHVVGCQNCPGTHNYRGSWSFLDVILFSKNLGPQGTASWKLIPESITIPRSQAALLQANGSPLRFDDEEGTGVSDHFPVYVRLAPRKTQ